MAKPKSSFLAFFLAWATFKGWEVPPLHVRMCHFLETRGRVACMMVFRGAAKSTILAVYNAWRYWDDPTYRILHQGDQDPTAYKTSRDTKSVLMRHPWTRDAMVDIRGDVKFWWVPGATDERNPSMQAAGIMSNITSSRADEVQNDDVEVPRNIATSEAREKLRYRLGEQTHILVPGGRELYIGTPHTHDSLYKELLESGADALVIPMFEQECRFEDTDSAKVYRVPFKPDVVFAGIHKYTRVLVEGRDFKWRDGALVFDTPPGQVIDCYAGPAWPDRFTLAELAERRKKCRTLNAWDSQYQLHSRPVHETRLDPEKLVAYDCEPVLRMQNFQPTMWLGDVQMVGAKARWDCSLGKVKSDASAVAVMFTDAAGRLYWHRSVALTGELEQLAPDGKTLVGGQIKQLADLLAGLNVPSVTIETNGPGGFVPAIARKHLKPLGIAVREDFATVNKQKRILDAFEAPLSSGFLWAHVSVLESEAVQQMADFNPQAKNDPDDFIDAGAGAIVDTPVRIGKAVGILTERSRQDWRPDAGVFEVELSA